jgi:hypothetical protein
VRPVNGKSSPDTPFAFSRSRRAKDEEVHRCVAATRQGDEELAETIYSTLLYGGSRVAWQLMDGAGKETVRLFVQQVLRANKAIKC